MDIKKGLLIAGAVIAAAVVAVVVFISNGQANGDNKDAPVAAPSPSASFAPLPVETSGPVADAPSQTPTATATPTPVSTSKDEVPVVVADLQPIKIPGFGSSDPLEANLTPEEITARDNIYKVIPVMANLSSPKYTSPLDARDELVGKGLITGNMANTGFLPQFTPFQKVLHDAGYTVQTTGLKCIMRTLTPQTPLELGKVTCYFTRHYVDAQNASVSNATFVRTTGGAGSIDPTQISRVEVSVKQEGGSWKVDGIRFN